MYDPRHSFLQRHAGAIALVVVLGIVGNVLFGRGDPTRSPDAVCKRAVAAMNERDWAAYSKVLITPSDFELRHNQISAQAASQSFAGSVMRPTEIEQHRYWFGEMIAHRGPQQIPWSHAQYKGLGERLESVTAHTLSGGDIPYDVYGVRVKFDGKVVDTSENGPWFLVAHWSDGQSRLLAVAFEREDDARLAR